MATQRWTDDMIDALASSVVETRESITQLRESNAELRESMAESNAELRESTAESNAELRESIAEVKDGVDGLRVTTQALLTVAGQTQRRMDKFEDEMEAIKQRQAESDERFNVLLSEVRYLIRGNSEED